MTAALPAWNSTSSEPFLAVTCGVCVCVCVCMCVCVCVVVSVPAVSVLHTCISWEDSGQAHSVIYLRKIILKYNVYYLSPI